MSYSALGFFALQPAGILPSATRSFLLWPKATLGCSSKPPSFARVHRRCAMVVLHPIAFRHTKPPISAWREMPHVAHKRDTSLVYTAPSSELTNNPQSFYLYLCCPDCITLTMSPLKSAPSVVKVSAKTQVLVPNRWFGSEHLLCKRRCRSCSAGLVGLGAGIPLPANQSSKSMPNSSSSTGRTSPKRNSLTLNRRRSVN